MAGPVSIIAGVPSLVGPTPQTGPIYQRPQDGQIEALEEQAAAVATEKQSPLAPWQLRGPNNVGTDWYFAPQSGSDSNDGQSRNTPLRTFAEYIRRIGSAPYATNPPVDHITLNWLEDQLDESDPITLLHTTHDLTFTMQGQLVEVGSGTFGAVTNVNRPTAQLTTGVNADVNQPANFWTQYLGFFVNDVTAGTWFYVDRDLGNRKAQFTRPVVGPCTSNFFSAPNALGSINPGDDFVIYRFTKVHMGLERVTSFTDVSGGTPSMIFQHLHFASAGQIGAAAVGALTVNFTIMIECLFDAVASLRSYPEQSGCVNCYANIAMILDGSTWVAGGFSDFVTPLNNNLIDGDAIVHGTAECWGPVAVGLAYFDSAQYQIPTFGFAPPLEGSLIVSNYQGIYKQAAFWGPTKLVVHPNGRVYYDVSATTQFLNTGGFELAGLATGGKVTPGAPRVVTDGIAITPASIDDVTAGKAAGMIASDGSGAGFFLWK